MYKTIFGIFAVTFSIAAPGLSFAQSTQPLTRAEVRADLVRVEQAGYSPGRGDDVSYPVDIQAAEAKVAMEDSKNTARQDVGGVALEGHSAAGARAGSPKQSNCVGPVSFCTPYFGS
jgi:hypothetical protein